MVKALSMRISPAQQSFDARLNLLAVAAIGCGALLFVYTRRIEVAALIGLPLALRMVTSFRTSALVTSCAMLVWLSRAPMVFFDLMVFSYVVYAAVAITIAAFFVRFVHGGASRLPLVTNLWLALFVVVVVLGGLNGLRHVEAIPAWILVGTSADYGVPWVYFRTIVLPGLLLPLLAGITAIAIADRQKLETTLLPLWGLAAAMALLVLGFVASAGVPLGTMADASYRNEHLKDIGFHSNELGTFLALAYALLIGARSGMTERRARALAAVVLAAIAVALVLTFSRGALLAFLVINGYYFLSGSPRKRALFGGLVLLACLAAPAAVLERARFGLDTRDLNEISAGRLDNIWLPLLPDVGDHVWFGQGLHSIMWTDAQRLRQMYPVSVAHNAYLDLVLDVGIVGGALILCWYAYLWGAFRRGAAADPDVRYRGVFHGGQLAIVALFVCALSNDRLTPTAPACLLWVVSGVLLGRQVQLQRAAERLPAAHTPLPRAGVRQTALRPLVMTRSRGEI
jgi:O-antigen ligase